jgi:large repetitive protein
MYNFLQSLKKAGGALSASFAFVFFFFATFVAMGQTTVNLTNVGAGTWRVPAGVASTSVECWGAGGGVIAPANNNSLGGAGGGAYVTKIISGLTSGNEIDFSVGAGGAATGGDGGDTWFFNMTTVLAKGGTGRSNTAVFTGGPGGQAAACIGDNPLSGGAGAPRQSVTSGGGGGGAAGSTNNGNTATTNIGANAGAGYPFLNPNTGKGGDGTTVVASGQAGANYGGGAGASARTGGTGNTGQAGGQGVIRKTFTCPTYSLTTTAASTACAAGTSTITLTSSAAGLPAGIYTVTYDLSGDNTSTGSTATFTVSTAGSGSFSTIALANAGSTTITIASLSSGGTTGVANSGCSNAITVNGTATITVNAPPTASITTASGSVAAGGTTDAMDANTPTSPATGAWSVASVPVGGDAGDITFNSPTSPTTTISVDAGAVLGDYTLRWTVSNSPCTAASADFTLTVTQGFAISGFSPTSVCAESGETITITGIKLTDATEVTIGGKSATILTNTATEITATIPDDADTDEIISVTTADGTVNSSATLTISPTTVGGSVTGGAAVCTGTNSTALELENRIGTVVNWQSATASNFSGATDIAHTALIYTAEDLTVTTYFRAVVKSGACAEDFSDYATVTVNALPNVSNFSTSATSPVAQNGTSTVTVTSSSLQTGTYTVTYSLTGDNAAANETASMSFTAGAPGTGTFTTISLDDIGSTDLTINSVRNTSTNCLSNVSTGNIASITVSAVVNTCPASTAVTPAAAQSGCIGFTAGLLTANSTTSGSTGTPTILYQWYYNTTNSNTISGATAISGATSATYTPLTTSAETGTRYYFCVAYATDNDCSQLATTQGLASNVVEVRVNASTAINTQPTSPSPVCRNATSPDLSVSASGTGTVTYQWYSNTTNSNTGGTSISTATNSTYSAPTTTVGTTYYYVVVSSDCGTDVTSNAVAVVVNALTTITSQPSSPSAVCEDATSPSLSVSASGTGTLTYQWYSNATNSNSGGDLITGATNSSYSAPTSAIGTTYYYVVVSGDCGSVTSSAVSVVVNDVLTITTQPTSPSAICQGATSPNLNIIANGTGTLTYQWYSNTANNNSGGTSISTVTNSTYSAPTTAAGTTYYYVVVTDACGDVASDAVSVVVNASTAITTQPASPSAVCKDATSPDLSVTAIGTGVVTYQWYSNTLNSNTGGSSIGSATSSTYSAPTSTVGTTYYYVVVSSDCGNSVTSDAVSVVVNALTAITTQPVSPSTLCQGATSPDLSVSSDGATLTYQWFSNSANSNSGGTSISSATSSTYAAPTTASGTTYYYVVVSGACGTAATSDAVAVIVTASTAITTQPASPAAVCENGTSPDLSVVASGTGTVTYQWYSNSANSNSGGTIIPTATNSTYSAPTATTGTTYYYVEVASTCGTETSDAVAVVVNAPTSITTQPVSPAALCQGATSPDLSVSADGSTLTYQWYSNTTNSNTGGTSISTATTATYSAPTSATGTTYYYVVVTGDCGTATSNAVAVTINAIPAAPTATNTGPSCQGSTVTLGATTIAGASYNWTGPNGFTSAVQSPTATVAGAYSVTATVNGCTSAASATTVVINAVPNSPTASNNGPVCEGSTVTLGATTITGATYAWTGPNGFTSSNQNTTTIVAGAYSVTATVNGCTSAAGSTTVVINNTPTAPTASNDGPACEGSTVTLEASDITGATYSWTGPNGFTSNDQNPIVTEAGTYIVTATVNGCASTAVSTNVEINAIPEAPEASNNGPVCEGSTITLSASDITDATYSWTGPNGFTSDDQNPIVTEAGIYIVTATVNGCTSDEAETTVVIADQLLVILNATDATCFGSDNGSLTATVNGGSGDFSYEWNTTPVQTTATASGLEAGIYSVTVTDNVAGCSTELSGAISEPTAFEVDYEVTDATCITCTDGSVIITVTGGTDPYEYEWSNQQTESTITDLLPGDYTVTITDANGCTLVEVVEVGYNVSVNEYSGGFKSVNIYPNPANAVINYSATIEGKELVVQLVDVQGRIISTATHTSFNGVVTSTVNTSVLNPGIYQLRFISEKGVSNKKFIVAH